jgi:hypothetical protein
MALLPSTSQIPAQRVPLNEPPQTPIYTAREWYRFFDLLHTYIPTPSTFTPSFTPVTNVAALVPGATFYNQMGTVITLTGTFTLTPAAPGNTVFRLTPPVLEDLSLTTAAGIFVTTAAGASDTGSIIAASGNLEFRLNAVTTTPSVYAYNVNYQIA